MKEQGSDAEDSDLSEESKKAIKPRKAKQNMAAANREMPPNSSDEEDEDDGVEVIVEQNNEEEKKEEEDGEEDSEDDDEELERLYGMGQNNNKNVKVCIQSKQGVEAADPNKVLEDASDDEEEDEDD